MKCRAFVLKEEMATYSSILAWKPMDRRAWLATVHRSQRVGHDEQLRTHTCLHTSYCIFSDRNVFLYQKNTNVSIVSSFASIIDTIMLASVLIETVSKTSLNNPVGAILSSVQFSHSVVSNSLRPHVSHHARPPCPSPSPGVHADSHPSSP